MTRRRACGHLRLVPPGESAPIPHAPMRAPRHDLAVIEAARAWADVMHEHEVVPGLDRMGRAALALLDAVHDLDHHEVNHPSPGQMVISGDSGQ